MEDKVKQLLEENCRGMYVPGMGITDCHLNAPQDAALASRVDTIMASRDFLGTDMFYLEAIATLKMATAEMVADYFIFYENKYGKKECADLRIPKFGCDALRTRFCGIKGIIRQLLTSETV